MLNKRLILNHKHIVEMLVSHNEWICLEVFDKHKTDIM